MAGDELPINSTGAAAANTPLRVFRLDPTRQVGGPWENSTQVPALLLALSLCCHPSLSADMVSLSASTLSPRWLIDTVGGQANQQTNAEQPLQQVVGTLVSPNL